MLSIEDRPVRLCGGLSRRELLRVGGLSALGLSLPTLIATHTCPSAASVVGGSFGRAKNVIFLWLQGGPPQHETFDPKPDAPAEIRGEFAPIHSNVPGISFCELLPRIAARADRLAVVRSLCTHTDLHDASAYWVLTGYPYTARESRRISPTDWPYLGSVLKQLKPSTLAPAFSSVWLPDVMRLNDNVMPAGQTAGFLGPAWEPHRLVCDPAAPDFKIDGLLLPADVPPLRLSTRRSLLQQANQYFEALERHETVRNYSSVAQEAWGLLASGRGREAFNLQLESSELRDRYGRNKWGQSLILARRLIEAGARLVHVNWPRDPGDEAVSNPLWDTHAQNSDRLQDVLCPIFDVGFSALLDDLHERGLLAETLVVAIGEFGRTPKINAQGGRDHWGHVFSFALAGAGIAGGQVYGSSDRQGAYPRDDKLEPQDLSATIVHLLGIDHRGSFHDAAGRPFHITRGEPLYKLLGEAPATLERVVSNGNLAVVPPYSRDALLNLGFEEPVELAAIGSARRLKGWQAAPMAAKEGGTFGVCLLEGDEAIAHTGRRVAALGYSAGTAGMTISTGETACLTQELRNPRAGLYSVKVHVGLLGSQAACREFPRHFRCQLLLFGYRELAKNVSLGRRDFSVVEFHPARLQKASDFQEVTVSSKLRSQDSGASEIELGVGIAIRVEKIGEPLVVYDQSVWLCVDDVEFNFVPRPRNDDVVV